MNTVPSLKHPSLAFALQLGVAVIVLTPPLELKAMVQDQGGLAASLRRLEQQGFSSIAAILRRRVRQKSTKMKLSAEQAEQVAHYVIEDLSEMPSTRQLTALLPHSSIELLRAAHQRGVDKTEAEAIARYLIRLVEAMKFDKLKILDQSHSHVIGREWEQIDYSGEGMTWQAQKSYWSRHSVPNFKTARAIHHYFVRASRFPHFAKFYGPRGILPAPPDTAP
jgi:hypothetical protein